MQHNAGTARHTSLSGHPFHERYVIGWLNISTTNLTARFLNQLFKHTFACSNRLFVLASDIEAEVSIPPESSVTWTNWSTTASSEESHLYSIHKFPLETLSYLRVIWEYPAGGGLS
jgi:hypothetical protein